MFFWPLRKITSRTMDGEYVLLCSLPRRSSGADRATFNFVFFCGVPFVCTYAHTQAHRLLVRDVQVKVDEYLGAELAIAGFAYFFGVPSPLQLRMISNCPLITYVAFREYFPAKTRFDFVPSMSGRWYGILYRYC